MSVPLFVPLFVPVFVPLVNIYKVRIDGLSPSSTAIFVGRFGTHQIGNPPERKVAALTPAAGNQ
jgi:hypothetical protein